MIRLRQIKVDFSAGLDDIKKECAHRLSINIQSIKKIKINKQSFDARFKPNLYYVYEVDIEVDNEDKILSKKIKDVLKTLNESYCFPKSGLEEVKGKIVIVGSGPAGLFCGYFLALKGYQPLIIERGNPIEQRVKDVELFWEKGILNTNSNVQFGEGGAGTFSDGKLNSQIKDKNNRVKKMLEIFVEVGASKEILYMHNPHIGTDVLRKIMVNLRNKIIALGGEFRFNTCLTNLNIQNNKLHSIVVNNKEEIECTNLVLAIGHSAHDTFKMLYSKKLDMESKPFAIGFRLQHPQSLIDYNQYGRNDIDIPASYKLTYKASTGRGVYSFCMCPGGYVVNSSSDLDGVVINGMSNSKRDSGIANSAIIVTVSKNDFDSHPLAGIKYQRVLEKKAFELSQGKIPVQLYVDFKKNSITKSFGSIKPMFKGEYTFTKLNDLLPIEIEKSLIEGIEYFDTKIKGFANNDVVMSGIESRTSSPVRIIRDDKLESNIKGIYPCGEGAGYAGGITSSAIDGMKIAEEIIKRFKPN